MLVGLGAVGSVAVLGATIWALQPNRRSGAGEELYSTDNRTTADGLANLPRDYTGLPRNVPPLGPPLPGDLGRPIVAAQANGQPVTVPSMPTAPVDQEEQRRLQEREAARLSKLFAGTSVREQAATSLPSVTYRRNGSYCQPYRRTVDQWRAADGHRRRCSTERPGRQAGLRECSDRQAHRQPRSAASAGLPLYVVQAGTLIAGALLTGIQSDLPGQITGQVTENVYDSPTGRYLLIPQGAKLIGIYDSQVTFGQSRVLLVWTRLIMPNGRSIVLERQPGTDPQGYSGLEDGVDNHWGQLFKAALLSTLAQRRLGGRHDRPTERPHPGDTAGCVELVQPDRAADRWTAAQHSADPDDPARFSRARFRQPRPGARTLWRLTPDAGSQTRTHS